MACSGARLAGGRSWLHLIAFAATMAITITVIVDMEYPRLGLIRVDGFEHIAFDLPRPAKAPSSR